MTPIEYKEIFNHTFLEVLSNWQKGWGENQEKRRFLADNLVNVCKNLPSEFKICNDECYRKRFVIGGEIVPIILEDDFFDGITSWTLNLEFAKSFKYLVRQGTTFAMIFKQKPRVQDVIININTLWENDGFKQAVFDLKDDYPEIALPLLNFKDYQSEVVLRTTLKGSEIEQIVGISKSFEEICDMAGIVEDEREALSIKYAKDPNGIPISFPTFASSSGTKRAVQKTIKKMQELIEISIEYNIPIYNINYNPHSDDLKHRVD